VKQINEYCLAITTRNGKEIGKGICDNLTTERVLVGEKIKKKEGRS
jgi:hypothetical protein